VPSLVYETAYDVVFDKPFNTMVPVAVLHVVGLVLLLVVIIGVGFTVTRVVPATELQVAVEAITLYVPDADVVAFAIEGFERGLVKLLGPVHA
jgi:hypothetical protein